MGICIVFLHLDGIDNSSFFLTRLNWWTWIWNVTYHILRYFWWAKDPSSPRFCNIGASRINPKMKYSSAGTTSLVSCLQMRYYWVVLTSLSNLYHFTTTTFTRPSNAKMLGHAITIAPPSLEGGNASMHAIDTDQNDHFGTLILNLDTIITPPLYLHFHMTWEQYDTRVTSVKTTIEPKFVSNTRNDPPVKSTPPHNSSPSFSVAGCSAASGNVAGCSSCTHPTKIIINVIQANKISLLTSSLSSLPNFLLSTTALPSFVHISCPLLLLSTWILLCPVTKYRPGHDTYFPFFITSANGSSA